MKVIRIVLLFLSALTVCACKNEEKGSGQSQGATSYPTMTVTLGDRTLVDDYMATIRGCQTVEIRPQVSGMITDILINEGDLVRKGEVLFVIDQTPYTAAYEIAVANVKSAEAALSTARLVLDNNKELAEQKVVSEVDLMISRNDVTEAEAKLALAKAEETNAFNNLSYTEVKSPVNGVASMIPYRVGALVNSNIVEPLVTVSDDSQIYAYFSMAENQMLNLIQEHGSLRDAIKKMPEVELRMSNGEIYAEKGRINAISGTINGSTGAVSLRAVFPNRDRLLRDGGSGVVMSPSLIHNSIVIPQTATYELQDRIFVYKVVDGRAVSTRIEVLPQNNGTEYVVVSGLQAGDVIVSEGAGLIREGTVITPETKSKQS